MALPPRPRRDDRHGDRLAARATRPPPDTTASTTTAASPSWRWSLLAEEPAEVVAAIDEAIAAGDRPRGARPRRRLRRGPADHPLPHPERPRRLGRGAPRLHVRQRRCTRRSCGRRHPSCCAPSTTARCASTSTASSTSPPPGCPSRHRRRGCRPRRAAGAAGTRRAGSTRPAPSSTATWRPAAIRVGRSPRWATRC